LRLINPNLPAIAESVSTKIVEFHPRRKSNTLPTTLWQRHWACFGSLHRPRSLKTPYKLPGIRSTPLVQVKCRDRRVRSSQRWPNQPQLTPRPQSTVPTPPPWTLSVGRRSPPSTTHISLRHISLRRTTHISLRRPLLSVRTVRVPRAPVRRLVQGKAAAAAPVVVEPNVPRPPRVPRAPADRSRDNAVASGAVQLGHRQRVASVRGRTETMRPRCTSRRGPQGRATRGTRISPCRCLRSRGLKLRCSTSHSQSYRIAPRPHLDYVVTTRTSRFTNSLCRIQFLSSWHGA
jgi:hypothetical protein